MGSGSSLRALAALPEVALEWPGAADVLVDDVVLLLPGDPPPRPGSLVLLPLTGQGPPAAAAAVIVPHDAPPSDDTSLPILRSRQGVRWSDLFVTLRAALQGGHGGSADDDLFEFANALAADIGGAVAIEDHERRVLAFSTSPDHPTDEVRRAGILGRRVPEHVERDGWYRTLWASAEAVELAAGPSATARVALALRHAGEAVGSIWVIGGLADLRPGATRALQQAAPQVTAALLRSRRAAARTRQRREVVLNELLTSGGTVERDLAGVVLVGLRLETADGSADDELRLMRCADVLSLHAARHEDLGMSAVLMNTVYALMRVAEPQQLPSRLREILERSSGLGADIAISPALGPDDAMPAARRDVDALLDMLGTTAATGVRAAFTQDVQHVLLLWSVGRRVARLPQFEDGPAQAIAAHDREHGTDYVPSLRAWFRFDGDAATASAHLHIHPNTLRYRISRAVKLFGLDLDDPDHRLLLQLQLRLAELRGE